MVSILTLKTNYFTLIPRKLTHLQTAALTTIVVHVFHPLGLKQVSLEWRIRQTEHSYPYIPF
jgi:hypothetical protein